MSLDPVMRVVAEHWDSIESHLTVVQAQRFRVLVGQFTAAGAPADQFDAVDELLEMLVFALPASHPVRRAIADPDATRSASALAPAEDQELMEELRRILDQEPRGPFGPQAVADNEPGPLDEITRDAMERLLAVPALSAADLRRRGGDPAQEHLIRLEDRDGPRFPVFQFDASGRPLRLVLEINALLDADADPWGVADWWLGRNSWLSRAPAELIGQVADELLLASARAVAEAGC
jgi:hypothetical protein